MVGQRTGLLARAWFCWKALRLPWRKRFFVGYDLNGNTYWQFRLTTRGPPPPAPRNDPTSTSTSSSPSVTPGVEPWRRIVHYPRSMHYSDVRVSPLWHQWLRQTRHDPPSLDEQRQEVQRQARIKVLAAEADARWEATPRVADGPKPSTYPGAAAAALSAEQARPELTESQSPSSSSLPPPRPPRRLRKLSNANGPGDEWQPSSWTPR